MSPRSEWPLVAFTLLFPTSVAMYCFSLLLPAALSILRPAAISLAWALAAVALLLTPFHLSRPLRAPLALAHLARSWLSREIWLATLWAGLITLHAFEPAAQWSIVASTAFSLATLAVGLAALGAGARAHHVPGRPGWRFGRTLLEFAGAGAGLALIAILGLFSTAVDHGAIEFPGAAAGLRIGALLPALAIGLQWVYAEWQTRAFASAPQRLPSHPTPAAARRAQRVAAGLSGLALATLAGAAAFRPDTLLFLLALAAQAIAAWFYRRGFFARAFPLDVRGLAWAERRRRMSLAAGLPAAED